jgi:deferrochelatase/peroxidase EfeB
VAPGADGPGREPKPDAGSKDPGTGVTWPSLSRRRFLASAALATGSAALGGLAGYGAALASPLPTTRGVGAALDPGLATVPFDGLHQAGIVTPAQERLVFAAFDLTSTRRKDLVTLLASWTDAARRMSAGAPVGDVAGTTLAPPVDTGEALGLAAASLTITVGFGPSLFDPRFGLAAHRPGALVPLPPFPGDALEPGRSGGDLAIQACANDPLVAFHAVRNLARMARGTAVVRWFQLGFGRTSSTSSAQATPRNLMGFKDGTNNLVAEDETGIATSVWVGDESDQAWMRGGSYLVARRIRMRIEAWDRTALAEQEQVIGRQKVTGAPLGATLEHDPVPLGARRADGGPVIAADAHIRLAAPATNGGERILRRGYSFTDGIDPRTGELDAGLFFICFQRDPARQFVAIQRRLAAADALGEYIRHTGSAVFACPPGTAERGRWGDGLHAG